MKPTVRWASSWVLIHGVVFRQPDGPGNCPSVSNRDWGRDQRRSGNLTESNFSRTSLQSGVRERSGLELPNANSKNRKKCLSFEGIKVKKSQQGRRLPYVPMYIHLVRQNMYRKLSKPKPRVNLAVGRNRNINKLNQVRLPPPHPIPPPQFVIRCQRLG